MKVKIIENKDIEEDVVTIECTKVNDSILHIVKYIENYDLSIFGKMNGSKYIILLNDIFYFEAVDNHVFAYTLDAVYEVNYKIQEINDNFSHTSFIQTSRTMILNIDKIEKVSTLVNGRILAVLVNKEKQIITRAYAANFKLKLLNKGGNVK